MIRRIAICLISLLTLTSAIKVSTTGYHVVHNDHNANAFHGFKYYQGKFSSAPSVAAPLALPLIGYVFLKKSVYGHINI